MTFAPPTLLAVEADSATDEELLLACAEGDREAFEALYRRVMPRIRAVTRRVLRDPAIADEVAQEVLLEVWCKSDAFDASRGRALAWLSTMAHRRAVDRVRSEQAARDRVDRVGHRDREQDHDVVASAVTESLDHLEVRLALRHLSQRQREAVALAYWGGRTYRQVAEELGIPEGTAKSRLRDGLARLRMALEDRV